MFAMIGSIMAISKTSGVLIIMPAWNEAEVIGRTIRDVQRFVPHDILVVDDGSTDETANIARKAGTQVLQLPFNLGICGALRAGFKYALRHGYEAAIQVDSDGQHDPSDAKRVLLGLETADISIGARFAGQVNYDASGPRRWAMPVLAKVISNLAGTELTHVTSVFRAANRRALSQYVSYFPAEYLGDTIYSLVVAAKYGCRVTQVPVEMHVRQAATPSIGPLKSTIYLARSGLVLCFALARRRTTKPNENRAVYLAVTTGKRRRQPMNVDPISVFSIVVVLVVLQMLRRGKLRKKYPVLGLAVGTLSIVLGLFPNLLGWSAGIPGVLVPSNLLFALAIVLLLGVELHVSRELTILEDESRTLADKVAIPRTDLEELRSNQQ